MPPYATPEDLTVHGVNAEAIEGLNVDQHIRPAIAAAEGMVNGYLRNRYTLPLTSVGADLRRHTAVIAAWEVLRVRGIKPGENPQDLPIYLEYLATLKWLGLVAGGTVVPELEDSDPGTPGASSGGRARISSNESRGFQSGRNSGFVAFSGRRR